MESIINKKSPNNRKILLNNISGKNKGARDGVDRDSNLSESFENFNIINYLTNSDQKENLIPVDNDNLNVIKKSSDNSTTNRNTKTDTNDKVLERKSNFDFLDWLCTPDSTNTKEREKKEQNETDLMNMSLDSFMECIMNPVIQSQHNLSCSDFDDVMNSFLSARTNSPTSSEVERTKSPALLAKSIIRKRNSNATLLKSSVQENCQNRQKRSPNLLQSMMSNSSSSNSIQENSQNRQNFDVLFVKKREPNRESSIICTKRKITEESWNLSKRQCRSRVIIYRDISIKNILIPDFDLDTVSKFNNNWISFIGSSQWLESRIRETITNDRKSTKINIFVDNFESKSQEQPLKVKCLRSGRLKVYKLQCLLITKQSSQNYDIDTLFKILSQNENAKIQSETVQDLSTSVNLNDSQVSQESAESNLSMSQRTLRKGLNEICQNQNIGNQNDDYNSIGRLVVLSRIQQIFIKIFGAFQDQKIPCLSVRHRDYKNSVFKDDMLQLKPINEASMRIIKYNAKPSHSKFCLILYLLAKIYQLVEHNTKLTKREIFYQVKHLIKNQTQISNAVDEISCLLNIGIWKLNIVSQKGLVYGDLRLVFSSGETLNCNVPGTLISFNVDEIVEIRSRAYFILVVEKESIFHKLIEEDLPNKMTRPFLIITGKGYPNLYTQLFLKKLWRIMSIPVFILVDPDPFGIHIMLNYRFGSMNHSHLSKDLALPKARWLGVFPSEIVKFGIKTTPITRRDRRMIQNLIASPYMNTHQQIKRELELLLETNLKASIEGLIKTNKFLSSSYLPTKFVNRDFI